MESKDDLSNEEFRKVFIAYYAKLCEVLPVEDILPSLVNNELITVQEMEEISAEKTSSSRARALLRGPVRGSIEGGCTITFIRLLCIMRSLNQVCVQLSEDICTRLQISGKIIEDELSRECYCTTCVIPVFG